MTKYFAHKLKEQGHLNIFKSYTLIFVCPYGQDINKKPLYHANNNLRCT